MKKLWGKLPDWPQNTIMIICACIGFFIILPLVGEMFRSNILSFFLIWAVIPILLLVLNWSNIPTKLKESGAIRLRYIAVGMTISISFLFFVHYDLIRDSIGYNYLKGYQSEYYPDVDEFGRDQTGVTIYTDKWYTRFLLWLGAWGLFLLLFGIPFLTWQLGERIVRVSIKQEMGQLDEP